MKNIFKNGYFLIGLLLSLALLWPLFSAPYFAHGDNVQTIRIYEMDRCFKDGQIPCRWVPDLGGGYGYPLFNYYAPMPYYIGELAYLASGDLLIAAKFIFGLPLILSYIFMFLLCRKLWGSPAGGSLSATFYTFAPYHALNMYVRGAMGELWAMAFMPAVFWAFWRLKERSSLGNSLIFGLSLALLILSHNLSAMLLLPILLLLIIFNLWRSKSFRFLQSAVFGLLMGFLLSAFYFFPMYFEKDLVHVETTTVGYFSYTEHFKGLSKLILDRSWQYGSSIREVPGGEKDGLSYQIGIVHLLGMAVSLYVAFVLWKKNRKISLTILSFVAVVLISIFMIHPRSYFVWALIEPLKYLQFPWRLLLLVSFFVSILAGSLFLVINGMIYRKIAYFTMIILVAALNFAYFRPEMFVYISQSDLLSGENFNKAKMYAIFDFLPKSAEAPPAQPSSGFYEILDGESDIMDLEKGSDWLKFKTLTKTHTIIRINQYYFPEWEIKVDGAPIIFDYKNSLGLMNVILGEGMHTVETRLEDTPIREAGNTLTVFGSVVFIMLSIYSFGPGRKRLAYYLKAFNK